MYPTSPAISFLENSSSVSSLTNSIYTTYREGSAWETIGSWVGDLCSDNALRGSSLSDGGGTIFNNGVNQFQNMSGLNGGSDFLNWLWNNAYTGIGRANTALKAIREFDPSRDAAFRTFAETCIRNRVRSAVTAAARGKHAPLNDSISFDCAQWRNRPGPAQGSPEELVIDREEQSERLDVLKDRLSKFEAAVLRYYLGGLSYQEIAERTRRPLKSVDNAVQRIRRKVAQQLYSGVISES